VLSVSGSVNGVLGSLCQSDWSCASPRLFRHSHWHTTNVSCAHWSAWRQCIQPTLSPTCYVR